MIHLIGQREEEDGLSRAIRCSSYSYYTTSSFRNFNELTHGCGVWQRGFHSRNMILRQNRHATRFRGLTLQRRALVCVLCPLSTLYIEWVFSLVWQADGLIYRRIACGASKVEILKPKISFIPSLFWILQCKTNRLFILISCIQYPKYCALCRRQATRSFKVLWFWKYLYSSDL